MVGKDVNLANSNNSNNNGDNDGNTAEEDSSGVAKVPQIGHKGCGKTSLHELITGIRLPKGKDHMLPCTGFVV